MTFVGRGGKRLRCHWAEYNEEYLEETGVNYAVAFNGKTRFFLPFVLPPGGRSQSPSFVSHRYDKVACRKGNQKGDCSTQEVNQHRLRLVPRKHVSSKIISLITND